MMAFSVGFRFNLLGKPQSSLIPSVSSISFAVSSFSANNVVFDGFKKHNNSITQTRASAEGLPSELAEDSKFVPLNADDPTYGPPALLLLGFEVGEAEKIRQFLKGLDGDFMEIIYCTEDMINGSLWEAVNTRQPNLEQVKVDFLPSFFTFKSLSIVHHHKHANHIAKSLPRICFFSGLSGEEMMMFIDAFPETGLKPAVFAALVPNSADKPVAELIDEIMGDHEMLTAQQSGST
ncbi:Vacuolar acid trehalase [Gossypium australe]|uniref:Vacuolar acid trehalase n=1 Tax=Gossypium australe TaxID=47621 RepID=A0A5B6U5L1_9ROSI|nr:Vacuolar acid trehalase [Gossypium australe]